MSLQDVLKHLQGQHSQADHGRGGGGGSDAGSQIQSLMNGLTIKSVQDVSKLHKNASYLRSPNYGKFVSDASLLGTIRTRGYTSWTAPGGESLRLDTGSNKSGGGFDSTLTYSRGSQVATTKFVGDDNYTKSSSFLTAFFGTSVRSGN